jgi:DNA-binding transcriptional LysR family regulator
LALHGAGIARLSDYMVARPIRDGRLVALLEEQHHPERTPAYALFPPGTQKVPKVRVFLDFLMERLGRRPARAAGDEAGHRRGIAGSEHSRG